MSCIPISMFSKFLKTVFFLMVMHFLAGLTAAAEVTVLGTRIGGDSEHTRFVVDLSAPVAFAMTARAESDRVNIELDLVKFALPTGAGLKVRGLIKKFTYGTVNTGKSVFRLETTGPVKVERAHIIEAQGKQPARLVVDLVKSADLPVGDAAEVRPVMSEKMKTVVIDAGHGGQDPGAVSPRKVLEKDVVLAFARELKTILVETGRFKVLMTREDDQFIRLKDRVGFARENNADLFIAVHADIVRGQTARGTTLYTLSDKASDTEAEALAQSENRSDIIAGFDLEHENADVADMLIELVQRESKERSMMFSKEAAAQLQRVTMMTGKPVRSAGFTVLKAPDVPSVLVELGYLSSKEDEELMLSAKWRRTVAHGLASAIVQFFVAESKSIPAAATP